MPIYEYLCDDCGMRHEKLVMSKGVEITCPKCASRKQSIQLSVFSATGKSSGGGEANSFGGSCGCNPRGCGCN